MLKKLLILAFAGLLSPAYAAGTVPGFSLTPQYDLQGKIAPGCKLYVIAAGTVSTPQLAYQDSGLSIPAVGGSQLTCDATGRLPQFFLADGQIKFRLTDKNGVQIFTQDNLLVVGPSGGGGGGGTVDPTTVLKTGDIKMVYGSGVVTGFVRPNGRTIGSAVSGATERANADCQPLFEYLWNTDANLVVSTGRGASANADWVANKTITLPDMAGRLMAAMDDIGGGFKGRLNFANSTVLGAAGGLSSAMLALANLPNVIPSFTGISSSVTVTSVDGGISNGSIINTSSGGGAQQFQAFTQGSMSVGFRTSTGTVVPQGSNGSINGGVTQTSFSIINPMMVLTPYMKL